MSRTIKTADGLDLVVHSWEATDPHSFVGLLHGYGEHAARYDHLACQWSARGISTLAVDLRGHGKSPGVRGHVEHFNDYHLDATALIEALRVQAKGRPISLFGHSMGALLALDWLLAGCGKDVAGLLLTSPFLGVKLKVHPAKETLGRLMSSVWPTLALPSGLFGRDVTRDKAMAEAYDRDPLNNKKATARWFTEAMAAIERVFSRAKELNLPLLLLYGGDDRVADADSTERFAASLGVKDRSVERLPGHYHELVNEPAEVRDPLIARMGEWILARTNRSPS